MFFFVLLYLDFFSIAYFTCFIRIKEYINKKKSTWHWTHAILSLMWNIVGISKTVQSSYQISYYCGLFFSEILYIYFFYFNNLLHEQNCEHKVEVVCFPFSLTHFQCISSGYDYSANLLVVFFLCSMLCSIWAKKGLKKKREKEKKVKSIFLPLSCWWPFF